MSKSEQVVNNVHVDVKPSRVDTSFIGRPHEWDPRRLYSQTGADWQYRVDFDRLRMDRRSEERRVGKECRL